MTTLAQLQQQLSFDRGQPDETAKSTAFQDALDYLWLIIYKESGLFLFTGDEGVGKTTALRICDSNADKDIGILRQSLKRIDADNLSDLLGHALGVKTDTNLPAESRALRYFLKLGVIKSKGKKLVLLLDDVEEIHSSGAEMLKALINMKAEAEPLITIVICGRSNLRSLLDSSYRWGLQKLIRRQFEMQPVSAEEFTGFANQLCAATPGEKITIKSGAAKSLFRYSKGIPGKAANLITKAVRLARHSGAEKITSRMIRGAVSGQYRTPLSQFAGTFGQAGLALIALLVIPPTLLRHTAEQQLISGQPPVILTEVATPELASIPTEVDETAAEIIVQAPVASIEPTTTPVEPIVVDRADDILIAFVAPSNQTTVESEPATPPDSATATPDPAGQLASAGDFFFELFRSNIPQIDTASPPFPRIDGYRLNVPDTRTAIGGNMEYLRLEIPAAQASGGT